MKGVDLTAAEILLLRSALDSHRYWQLSDQQYRHSGFVYSPGSDDAEAAEEIAQCEALETKLDRLLGMSGSGG